MKTPKLLFASVLLCAAVFAEEPPQLKNARPLFDGKTLNGWECEPNPALFRVEDGCITGGNEIDNVKRNEFLATTRDYTNFIIRLKIKLTGKEGFVNSGFQIRSVRVPNSGEMSGYQCDYGEPNWYGAVYDESRRNKVLQASDMDKLGPAIKRQDWNEYVIRADGNRITTWINGVEGADYIEQDQSIVQHGKLGIQVHGGGKTKVQVKDIEIQELPAGPEFKGAAEPKKTSQVSPLSPEDERATFTLPPDFEIELVASESPGIGKFVTVAFDTRGRMWTMTALEYPVDANENPEAAKALYNSIARDKVLVFDTPFAPGPQTPRVFAEGLAIPLGILPYKDGVYVQHGPNIEFLRDSDGDGKADQKQIILTGFGVQDSHLFPHQFTRAPGNWIWFAQGAFNYGKVKTTKGAEQQFDQTRMAKFRYDGSNFDITSQGPCNIWGLVLKANGEAFIQEANDYGYPMMQFHEYANYPGCSDAQMKSYAPIYPGTAPDFQMGGTGLSGLALSDAAEAWPAPYNDIFYIANPITRKIQAIRTHVDGPRYKLEKLRDFILSSDEMFRPVSITFGPDGCLYIVDWYNKIISHNEVPRNHPDRDKTRGRIWRVKHRNQKTFAVPDFTTLPAAQLLTKLSSPSLAQTHLAWQAITDRQLTNSVPMLRKLAGNGNIPALWALEGLKQVDGELLFQMTHHADRNVRREAIRALGDAGFDSDQVIQVLKSMPLDEDPEVRSQIIRTAGSIHDPRAIAIISDFARLPLDEPMMTSTQNGKLIKAREAYEREFQRYLVRLMFERHREFLPVFIDKEREAAIQRSVLVSASSFSGATTAFTAGQEKLWLAALALQPKDSIPYLVKLSTLPFRREPSDEEILRLAQFPNEPGIAVTLRSDLQSARAVESLIRVRSKFDATALAPILAQVAHALWQTDSSRALAIQLVTAFRLTSFENDLVQSLSNTEATNQVATLRALREVGTSQDEIFSAIAKSTKDRAARQEALLALASSKSERAPSMVVDLWPTMNALQRRLVLEKLTSSKSSAMALLTAVKSGAFPKADLDTTALDKLNAVLPNNPDLAQITSDLTAHLQPLLRLDGQNDSYLDTDFTLEGPFTVETWIKLAPGIDNNDSILGAPGALDLNFYDAYFRVWAGPDGDVVVAKKKMLPNIWTHIAVTRNIKGFFSIYINGELDAESSRPISRAFEHLKIGWSGPPKGTDGWMNAFRTWNIAESAEGIRRRFDMTFANSAGALGLISEVSGDEWRDRAAKFLHGSAHVERVDDFPDLITTTLQQARDKTFQHFTGLAQKSGDLAHGKTLFSQTCATCHMVAGQGGQIGPVLNGAAANGIETLLRAVLTPNAAMEAGYRTFRVELKDGDVLDGFLVSQNDEAIILRQPNAQDRRISQDEVRRARFTKTSLMPEGLLDSLPDQDATDLLAYLQTLK